jgi:hypothetical protein
MFNIKETTVKFGNLNTRSELNGKTRRPAADINFSAQLPNSVLNDFAPGLLQFLYEPPKNPDLAEQADPDAATALRFPQIGLPLDFELELLNRTITIDYGLGGESNIVLPECTVHKFKVTPQNGGTVLVGFQISAHPDKQQAGWLYEHQQQDIVLTITAPAQDDSQAQLPSMTKKEKQNAAKAQVHQLFDKADGAPAEGEETPAAKVSPEAAWPFPADNSEPSASTAMQVE